LKRSLLEGADGLEVLLQLLAVLLGLGAVLEAAEPLNETDVQRDGGASRTF
jgi:hypothetical protein